MKKITFTTAGIAVLILLQMGTMAFVFLCRGHHRGHARGPQGPQGCHASYKEGGRGEHHSFKGGDRGSHHGGPNGFLEGIDLTKEQQTKIDALKQERQKTQDASGAQMKTLRMKQFQLLQDEKLDDAQAESIATEIGQLKKAEVLANMKFFRGVQSVLTKEQRDKLKERRHHGGFDENKEN